MNRFVARLALDFYRPLQRPDPCRRRHRGNLLSSLANVDNLPRREQQLNRVLGFIRERGLFGATNYEIHQALGLPYTTVSARTADLKAMNAIGRCELRRPTPTGSMAAALVIKELA